MKFVTGDITTAKVGVIIQGCNAQGVMRSGVAKYIRNKWPQVYEDYKEHEKDRGLILGKLSSLTKVTPSLWVANCITQQEYGYDGSRYASYDAIYDSVLSTIKLVKSFKTPIAEFHIPKIGCGYGGCEWEIVQAILEVIEKKEGISFDVWDLN